MASASSAADRPNLFIATPAQYHNHVLNIEYISANKDLYSTLGRPEESKYYTAYVHALLSAANDSEHLRNATPTQAAAVLNGLKDTIATIEKGQANVSGMANTLTGTETTYVQLLDGVINAMTASAATNGAALRAFIIENKPLVNGLMENLAFQQKADTFIKVEYLLAVAGAAAAPTAEELAIACRIGTQVCLAQANYILQDIVASTPELGGTGVGLAGIAAEKEAVETALEKVAAKTISRLEHVTAAGGDAASTAANRTPQVTINRQNGAEFEQQVIDALGPVGGVKNTIPQTVTLSNGTQVTTIPDLWGRNVGGLLEAKNVQNLSMSNQLRAQIQIANRGGQPLNLVVSPRR